MAYVNNTETSELNSTEADNQVDSLCTLCKIRVVKKISTCPGCKAPYHPAYMLKTPMIPGVGMKKCCGAPSPTHLTPCNPSLPALASMDQLRTVVREENEKLRDSISRMELSISNLTEQMTKQNDKIDKCESSIIDITSRLDILETNSDISSQNMHDRILPACLRECEDRMLRKNNLFIFGLVDRVSGNSIENKANDLVKVQDIFEIIAPGLVSPTLYKVKRIGFYSQSAMKPRPLKVIFHDQQLPTIIRESFFKTRNQLTPEFKNITIAPDRTKTQQYDYQRAKRELEERTVKGETNLVIHYHLGIPTITKKKGERGPHDSNVN